MRSLLMLDDVAARGIVQGAGNPGCAAGMMRRMNHPRRALRALSGIATVITVLLLSACGSSSTNAGGGGPTATSTGTSAPTTPPQTTDHP
jgi:hypothetical protein